jgi:hypothetical protein
MNKLKAEKRKQGRSKTWSNMTGEFPAFSQEKRHVLDNSKTTKEHLDEISAYNLELESDIALAQAAELT